MLETLVVIFRLIGLLCRGYGAVALENLALRPQLAALTRTRKRPQVRPSDRLFWCLASVWRCWRSALVVVRLTPSCIGIANGSAATDGGVIAFGEVGGLHHHRYERRACGSPERDRQFCRLIQPPNARQDTACSRRWS